MAGDAGAAREGVVERASSCWDCTGKKWKKKFPWKEKKGKKNSQERCSLSLFPECFIGLNGFGFGLVFFLKKKH